MADDREVLIRISAKNLTDAEAKAAAANILGLDKHAQNATQSFKQFAAEGLSKAGVATDAMGVSFGKLVGSMVSAQAIIGLAKTGFNLLVGEVVASVKAAGEAEKAHAQLNAALRAQGTAIPSVITAYQGYASALERTTIFQDDALEGAAALLVQIGNVMPRDMQKALTATTELASGLGIDLNTAATMVAKAAEGTTTGLKKLGVETTDAKGKALEFGAILDSITDKFGGQAAALAGTYEGRIAQLGNTWNNVEESVGRIITQNATLLTAFDLVNRAITGQTGELNHNLAVNQLVSSAVLGLAKALSITLEAIDLTQTGYAGLRIASNDLMRSFTNIGIAALDAATVLATINKYINPQMWAASNIALKEYADATVFLKGAVKGFDLDSQSAADTSARWGNQIQGLKGTITTMERELENTRGKTIALKDAIDTGTDAWGRHTKGLIDGKKAAEEAAKTLKAEADAWEFLQKKQEEAMRETTASMLAMNKGQPDFMKTWLLMQHHALQTEGKDLIDRITTFSSQASAAFVPGLGTKSMTAELRAGVTEVGHLSDMFVKLGQAAGGSLGTILGGLGQMTVLLDAANQSNKLTHGNLGIANDLFRKGSTSAEKWGSAVATAGVVASGAVELFHSKTVLGAVAAGAKAGAAFGPWGMAIGAGVGALVGGLKKLFGGASELEKATRAASEKFQDTIAAQLTGQQKLEAGGDKWKMTMIGVRDLYLATGKTAADAEQIVKALFDTKNPEAMKKAIEDYNKVVAEQANRWQGVQDSVGALNAFTASGIDTQGKYNMAASSAVAIFDAWVKKTGDVVGALAQIGPTLDTLTLSQDTLGLAGSAAVEKLLGLRAVTEANKPLMEGIAQSTALLTALDSAGLLANGDITAFGQNAVNQFSLLSAATGSQTEALGLMQPELQQLWEHQQKFHDITDEATLALLNQAETSGIVGEDSRDINEQILDVMTDIRDVIAEATGNVRDFGESINRLPTEHRTTFVVDEPSLPGHAGGGVFRREHIARIAEGGQPELVGSQQFVQQALEHAMANVNGGGVSSVSASVDVTPIAAEVARLRGEFRTLEGSLKRAIRDGMIAAR